MGTMKTSILLLVSTICLSSLALGKDISSTTTTATSTTATSTLAPTAASADKDNVNVTVTEKPSSNEEVVTVAEIVNPLPPRQELDNLMFNEPESQKETAIDKRQTNRLASGYYYDDYNYYNRIYPEYRAMAPAGNCGSGTCGQNAQCTIVGGRPVCACLKGYLGDPVVFCKRAECLDSSECSNHLTCREERCVDPCIGACGSNANCQARNHIPICSCGAGYTGDPAAHCRRFDPNELCHPSPCGVNTRCEVINEVPTCKCQPGFFGSPLQGCRHECESDSDCGNHLSCMQNKCQNPCSRCGVNAECETVRNHAPVCKCPKNYIGNPYSSCQPECTRHSDCPRGKPSCHYNKCVNPCEGACGVNANCEVRDITPVCSCPRDMTGDPYTLCRPFEKRDLCDPNPCGANAKCTPGYDRNNQERPVCTCYEGYQGDPIRGCIRGECTEDQQCSDSLACIDYKCQNPCRGRECGVNAECNPRHHIAVCTCPNGFNGDALNHCYSIRSGSASARYFRRPYK